MTTIPRLGFVRVGVNDPPPVRARRAKCRSGKIRHRSESDALTALVRVREDRLVNDDGRLPENRIYICKDCEGWHLTSSELHPRELDPVRERIPGETWQAYARRLERRIAEQRAQILSLHALGHGVTNRATRKRIASLVIALGRMTERWENERRNREQIVRQLEAVGAHRSLIARLRSRRRPGCQPEAVQATKGMGL